MIKGINQGLTGGYLNVVSNNYQPYISPSVQNPAIGMIRSNGGNMEVFDGSIWQILGQFTEISLSKQAIDALDWCQKKMIEEAKIKELCEKSPAVADAFASYNDAKSKLEVVLTLADQP